MEVGKFCQHKKGLLVMVALIINMSKFTVATTPGVGGTQSFLGGGYVPHGFSKIGGLGN